MNLEEKIFVSDIGALKGKNTGRKPKTIKDGMAEIPPEMIEQHKGMMNCMEMMYVHDIPMITGIDNTIRYQYMVFLNSLSSDELYKGIDKKSDNPTNIDS